MESWPALTVGILLFGGGQPPILRDALTTDHIAIYRSFLATYTSGLREPIYVAKWTTPLAVYDHDRRDPCLFGVLLPASTELATRTHTIGQEVASEERVKVIDVEGMKAIFKENSSSGAKAGFLMLSEPWMSADRRTAVMKYSFVCGFLCGKQAVVVLKQTNGGWTQSVPRCAVWME
jgi:hypothetical protein